MEGDGAVHMACEQGACACTLERLTAPNDVFEFEFAATCSSTEIMRQLIVEHCLKGMKVEAPAPTPDEGPGGVP